MTSRDVSFAILWMRVVRRSKGCVEIDSKVFEADVASERPNVSDNRGAIGHGRCVVIEIDVETVEVSGVRFVKV